ncbi:tRNA 2-selenouridine synthase, partial [Campylobacter rectus]|uniref:tRNA 2-selenouridine synthase n=1 Tax=Campylobacter rectus TaxID=203 RepID=UPI000F5DED00
MKFILSILAVLAIVFLVGCSAKDTRDNKLSNSEITKLGKKYGGVYVFNKKFEKEIDDREKEREAVNRQILDEVSHISDKDERNKKMRKLLKERYYGNPKIAQTLSNGKKYYTATRAYGEDYNKQAKLPEIYKEKIINFIGQEDYNKFKPSMLLSYFYVDDNK